MKDWIANLLRETYPTHNAQRRAMAIAAFTALIFLLIFLR